MTLSIVIPSYNERERLPKTFAMLEGYVAGGQENFPLREVIVVDDGSTDGTAEVAEGWKGRLPVRVIRFPNNRGKGAAVRAGMQAAEGDYCLLYDADGATPIVELEQFLPALREGADVLIGSRVMGKRRNVVMRLHRRIIGRVYHAFCSFLTPGIQDAACGFKLFTREVAKKLFSLQRLDRFAYDVEILALARGFGFRIVEVPVHWNAVPDSRVRLVRDTIEMTWSILGLYVRKVTGRLV